MLLDIFVVFVCYPEAPRRSTLSLEHLNLAPRIVGAAHPTSMVLPGVRDYVVWHNWPSRQSRRLGPYCQELSGRRST
jgi:hypothetical protein